MRSNVAESRIADDVRTRSLDDASYFTSRTVDPHSSAPPSRSKRQIVLVPAEGWLAMLLLIVAVYSVVSAIATMYNAPESFVLYYGTAGGLLVGFIIAKMHNFPQTILHLGACLIGHWLSIWLTSVIAFHISWLLLLENLRSVIMNGITLGGLPRSSSDMVFLFYLSFLSFFLGYFGAWLIYRAHLPWLVAFVYSSILLVTLNATGKDLPLLLLMLLGSLTLLIARIQLASQIKTWMKQGLYTDHTWLREMTQRFMLIAAVFVVLTMVFSMILPIAGEPEAGASLWNSLDNAWSNVTNGQISLQNPGSLLQPYQAPANFFGDQLAITGNVNLPSGEVLEYAISSQAQSHYLEGFTYDRFDGHTWTTSTTDHLGYDANTKLPVDTQGNYSSVTTSITIVNPPEGPKHFIFAPAQPASFDVATNVYGDGIPTAWAKQRAFSRGEHYQAQSLVLLASTTDLSSVPLPQDSQDVWQNDTNYIVLESYYLQTPTSLAPIVEKTAKQWTAGATNAYDAMKQLESHLSNTAQFTYSIDNPPVPENIDAVSWLLQARRGYCTYYASAMVMMARLLKLPARIVNGFSQGTYDKQRKVWVVNGTDAHSWVQVYFPTFGWVNFDPTPGYSLNTTNTPPASATPTPIPSPVHATPTPSKGQPHPRPTSQVGTANTGGGTDAAARQDLLIGLSLGTLFCSILVLLLAIFMYWWRSLYRNTGFATGMYRRVCRVASWVGMPPQNWQTPYEYSRTLGRHFPREVAPMRRLTELFVRERWAAPSEVPYAVEEDDLERLWPHFRRLFLRLFILRLRNRR